MTPETTSPPMEANTKGRNAAATRSNSGPRAAIPLCWLALGSARLPATSRRTFRINKEVKADALTPSRYERDARRLLTATEKTAMQESISANPEAHPVVPGTGGVRKARWGRQGEQEWRSSANLLLLGGGQPGVPAVPV